MGFRISLDLRRTRDDPGAFICGLFARRASVRIGYAPFLGQLITMVVRTGGGSLLPLGDGPHKHHRTQRSTGRICGRGHRKASPRQQRATHPARKRFNGQRLSSPFPLFPYSERINIGIECCKGGGERFPSIV